MWRVGRKRTRIINYRDEFESPLLADYSEKTKMCSTNELKDSISIKRIKINEEESNLIIESINELCKSKKPRENVPPPHGGIYYHFMLSDSSMIIGDSPSVKLKNFAALVLKIKQK